MSDQSKSIEFIPIQKTMRKDVFNNPIIKGSNSHKVIFRDQVNGTLLDVHIVENYKEYNTDVAQH
jgi:hypothetical protein